MSDRVNFKVNENGEEQKRIINFTFIGFERIVVKEIDKTRDEDVIRMIKKINDLVNETIVLNANKPVQH